jgi:hypothetical protein
VNSPESTGDLGTRPRFEDLRRCFVLTALDPICLYKYQTGVLYFVLYTWFI